MPRHFPAMNPDVLIIGGGVIGLSIARELHRRGVRDITLVEKADCGLEASWAAAGMLSPDIEAIGDDDFHAMGRKSRDLYPLFAEQLRGETGIDIGLDQTGTLHVALDDAQAEELSTRCDLQRKAGMNVEALSHERVLNLEPSLSPHLHAAALYPNDWQVENRRLMAALSHYAESNGINVCTGLSIDRLVVDHGRVAGAASPTRMLYAGMIVLATGAWTSLIKLGDDPMPFEIKPVRGQMIEFIAPERPISHVIYGPNGYVVPRADGRILVGSTTENAGFDKAVTREAAELLHNAAIEISPIFRELDISNQWSGLRPAATDQLPILGPIDGLDGLMVATGHYRNGILLAPLTAEIVADSLVNGVNSEYFECLGPDRFWRNVAGASS